ncbi:MAG: ABC transporter permease [Candidatus Cloacimonadaceae bacterium]|nr:ABC transporter permease [Candidatus Cloacimonadaceae bacterium]
MAIQLRESISIGLADIMTRKVRSAVTVIGIILGVMCIMVVLAIVNGMNQSTLSWMSERGGLNKIEVNRNWSYDFSRGGDASFDLREISYIRSQIPSAEAFNPQVQLRDGVVLRGDLSYQGSVIGVMPDMMIVEDWQVDKGRFFSNVDMDLHNNVIVLGSTMNRELFGSRNSLGEYVVLKKQKLMVVGVLDEKYWQNQGGSGAFGDNALEYLNRRAFVPISTMLSKLSPGERISSIEIKASSPDAAKELRQKLEGIILNLKGGKRLFTVSSAQEELDQMKQNTMIFSAVFILIAVISLLVGGIVIMNIMLASIKERTREIGVRIAVGARSFDVFVQFLVQTVLITGLGGVLGVILGLGILGAVGDYLNIKVAASVSMIFVALIVSVGVGLGFGIMPAYRASRLDPVVALREE